MAIMLVPGMANAAVAPGDEPSPDTLERVDQLDSLALAAYNNGDYNKAEPLYAEALRLSRELLGERHRDTLTSLDNYASVLVALGLPAEAEPLFAETLRLYREVLGERHPDTLGSLNNYAFVLNALGRSAEAEPLYAEALRLKRQVLGERHPDTLISLNNYATVLDRLGRSAEAEPLYAEALRLSREVLGERHPDTIISLNNYATVLDRLGRSAEAEPLYAEALRLHREVLGKLHPDTLTSLHNYAFVLNALGRSAEAEPLYAEALRLYREVLGERHPSTLGSLSNYAGILSARGRPVEAEPLYAQALRLYREVLGQRHPDTLTSLNNYAFALDTLGRSAEAEPLYGEALRLSREVLGGRHPNTINSLNNYALVLYALGRSAEAEPLFTEALRLQREVLGVQHPNTALVAKNLAMIRLRNASKSAFAIEPARIAVAALDVDGTISADSQTLNGLQVQRDRNSADVYLMLADAAYARGPGFTLGEVNLGLEPLSAAETAALREEAFAALQSSLTNVTSRAMARTAALRASRRSGVGEQAAERERLIAHSQALDAQIVKSYTESGSAADEKRGGLKASLDDAKARLQVVDAEIKRRAPDYYSLIRPKALSVTDAIGLLGSDEAALMLEPTEFGTQVMLVSDEGLLWHRSPLTNTDINLAVRRLMWEVGGNVEVSQAEAANWLEEGEGEAPYDFVAAYKLYHELIAPIAAGLKGKKQLFVSSSGALSSLPLGILVTEIPEGANGDPQVLRSAKWFADSIAISVIPSLQSLQFIRNYRSKPKGAASAKPYLGFGDPLLEGTTVQRGRGRGSGALIAGDFRRVFGDGASRGIDGQIASAADLRQLARLPETRIEIENQWKVFGRPTDSVFLGASATETLVKNMKLSAGVLTFATHGLLAGEIRGVGEPGLVLTPPTKGTEDDDGFLAASEISALKIDANWVILSACNTAAGDGSEGAPGLSGLSRSFFFAGATNLLVSHWPVQDDVASILTVRAIEIARDKPELSRAEALSTAMREIRNDTSHGLWAHPSAWAPFSLVGDGSRRN